MKKGLIFLIALSAGLLIAGQATAQSGIAGSGHDMRGLLGINEICVPCHTPHNAVENANYPLWNRTEYVSGIFPGSGPASQVCLSCHDGTVAVDSYGGNIGSTFLTGDALIDSTGEHHPIGTNAVYTPGPEYNNITDDTSPVKTFNSQVECSSCHNAHNMEFGNFLAETMVGSQLCLTCHNL
jgi:predicted CXXCH cytochrome family protein